MENFTRRQLLIMVTPLGWLPERLRDGRVSTRAGQISLTKDGLAIAVPALAACDDESPQPSNERSGSVVPIGEGPFAHWERYVNGSVPTDNVLQIAARLRQNKMYPGFSEVADVMTSVNTDPTALTNLLGIAAPQTPVGIKLQDSATTSGFTASLAIKPKNIQIIAGEIRDKKTGKLRKVNLTKVDEIEFVEVELDNSLKTAPDALRELLIVKEYSQLLYINELKQKIREQVSANLDIVEPKNPSPNLETFLYVNGTSKAIAPEADIPSMGDLFDHTLRYMDGAGYWHIMRAYGKMRRQKLSNGNLMIPDDAANSYWASDNFAFENALKQGLLIESNGEFTWKEGIGPFSPEWTSIVKQLFEEH